jgi:drug/metabolite transporter (DMT)-like permease
MRGGIELGHDVVSWEGLRTIAIGIAGQLVRQSILSKSSCPALCRASTSLKRRGAKDVDGRSKSGHDERFFASPGLIMSLLSKISTELDQRSARLAGIGLMLLSIFMFSFGDALGKFMVATYSVGQLLMLRACAALLVLLPMIWRNRAAFTRLERPWLQLLRTVLSTVEVAAFFLATVYLPLADVITYYLACPIFVTALSAIVLREQVGWRRWSAVLIGFGGVLIALRPSAQTVSWPAMIALGGSLSFAVLMLITRALRATPDIVLESSQFAGTFTLGALMSPFGWVTPSLASIGLFAAAGIISVCALLCVNRSLKLAQARAGERRGAVSIFHDRLGGGVWLCRVRRRAVDGDDRGGSDHHRRWTLHLPARANARARRGGRQSAGVSRAERSA